MTDRVVLITGASGGIGRAAADLFVGAGFRVFGGSRRDADIPGVRHVALDVRDDRSVTRGVQEVIAEAGRLDIVVNNAGYAVMGAIEETTIEQAHALFETNFFGAARVAAAVLPHMRERRAGRIVNVSSVMGFLPAPYMGFYGASKFAMEGWSQTLDQEVRSRGIRVVLVQPSFTHTELDSHGELAGAPSADYAEERSRVVAGIRKQIAAAPTPEAVAKTIFDAATARSPKGKWSPGREAKTLAALSRLLPQATLHGAVRKQFLLDDKTTPFTGNRTLFSGSATGI